MRISNDLFALIFSSGHWFTASLKISILINRLGEHLEKRYIFPISETHLSSRSYLVDNWHNTETFQVLHAIVLLFKTCSINNNR